MNIQQAFEKLQDIQDFIDDLKSELEYARDEPGIASGWKDTDNFGEYLLRQPSREIISKLILIGESIDENR